MIYPHYLFSLLMSRRGFEFKMYRTCCILRKKTSSAQRLFSLYQYKLGIGMWPISANGKQLLTLKQKLSTVFSKVSYSYSCFCWFKQNFKERDMNLGGQSRPGQNNAILGSPEVKSDGTRSMHGPVLTNDIYVEEAGLLDLSYILCMRTR